MGKILNRRPPTGSRQPKDKTRKERFHISLSRTWITTIERAARQLNLSRTNFIVQAAHEAAQKQLEKKA